MQFIIPMKELEQKIIINQIILSNLSDNITRNYAIHYTKKEFYYLQPTKIQIPI